MNENSLLKSLISYEDNALIWKEQLLNKSKKIIEPENRSSALEIVSKIKDVWIDPKSEAILKTLEREITKIENSYIKLRDRNSEYYEFLANLQNKIDVFIIFIFFYFK